MSRPPAPCPPPRSLLVLCASVCFAVYSVHTRDLAPHLRARKAIMRVHTTMARGLLTLAYASRCAALRNVGLVFIKPHAAASDAAEAFVRNHLEAAGINIIESGVKVGMIAL